jgi:hypothetical protein
MSAKVWHVKVADKRSPFATKHIRAFYKPFFFASPNRRLLLLRPSVD